MPHPQALDRNTAALPQSEQRRQITMNLPSFFPKPLYQFGDKVEYFEGGEEEEGQALAGQIVGMRFNTTYICLTNGGYAPGWEYILELDPFQPAILSGDVEIDPHVDEASIQPFCKEATEPKQ